MLLVLSARIFCCLHTVIVRKPGHVKQVVLHLDKIISGENLIKKIEKWKSFKIQSVKLSCHIVLNSISISKNLLKRSIYEIVIGNSNFKLLIQKLPQQKGGISHGNPIFVLYATFRLESAIIHVGIGDSCKGLVRELCTESFLFSR